MNEKYPIFAWAKFNQSIPTIIEIINENQFLLLGIEDIYNISNCNEFKIIEYIKFPDETN